MTEQRSKLIEDFLENPSKDLTSEQAEMLIESEWWLHIPYRVIAKVQSEQSVLVMDFGDFHRAVDYVVGRPVYVHEFRNLDHIRSLVE